MKEIRNRLWQYVNNRLNDELQIRHRNKNRYRTNLSNVLWWYKRVLFNLVREIFNANCSRIDGIIVNQISMFDDDILFLIRKNKKPKNSTQKCFDAMHIYKKVEALDSCAKNRRTEYIYVDWRRKSLLVDLLASVAYKRPMLNHLGYISQMSLARDICLSSQPVFFANNPH